MAGNITVPAEGSKSAKIVIVGEAPGSEEERYRRPFIGPAGRLLDRLLASAGIVRSACYITNVVKVRPYNNDIKEFVELGKKEPLMTKEFMVFKDELKSELEQTSANVIVAMGNTALFALTNKVSISKRRGSIYESTLLPGRKVIACLHTAAALRQFLYEYYIIYDLKRAKEESETPHITEPKVNIHIKPSFKQALEYMDYCSTKPLFAFDIEVMRNEVTCISLSPRKGEALVIPFMEGSRDYFPPDQELIIWMRLVKLLEDVNCEKLGQNLSFDCSFLFRKVGAYIRPLHDTMVAQGILFPEFPKGLDFITSVYTKYPYYKDEGKMHMKQGSTDESFWRYNGMDSIVCMDSWPLLKDLLKKQGNWETYKRQSSLIESLVYITERGMRLNIEEMRRKSDECGLKITELTSELHKYTGEDLNPNSPLQLRRYFYGTLGHAPYRNRSGGVTTDNDALKRLARKGVVEARIIQGIRKVSKLKSTYLDISLDEDMRLRGSLNPVGTANGRFSSSTTLFGTGTNIQNLPAAMKQLIIPDVGYAMYNIDLAQAENRIVAHIAPEPMMRRAFEEGIDVHALTASLLFDMPIEEVSDEDSSSPLGNGEHSQRFWGKTANHALNYGFGYKSFSLRFELPEGEGKVLVEKYHTVYPNIRHGLHKYVEAQLSKSRTLTNCFGRKRRFMGKQRFVGGLGQDLLREGFAFIPQSTVADKLNEHGILFLQRNQADFYAVELLNTVHDSLLIQIPLSVGFAYHAASLKAITNSLETPISWKGNEFVIPTDVTICMTANDKDGIKLDMSKSLIGLIRELETSFQQLNQPSVKAQV